MTPVDTVFIFSSMIVTQKRVQFEISFKFEISLSFLEKKSASSNVFEQTLKRTEN